MWIAQTEGAKFWLQVITEIKNRGVKDIFIACVDGLKGFPEAIEAVFPDTQRNSASSICCVTALGSYPGNSARKRPKRSRRLRKNAPWRRHGWRHSSTNNPIRSGIIDVAR